MEHAVQSVDEVLSEKGFVAALQEFTERHCDIFEASDENKLEYTPIFNDYATLIEKYVDSRLVEKGVDLEKFMADLPVYMEGVDAHPRTGVVLELLSSFDSFIAFKDMMLEAKKAKAADVGETEDAKQGFAQDLGALDFLKEKLDMTRVLEEGGAAEGWTLIADKTWIQTHRKKDPESPINLTRCFATCNMPAEAFMEIFMNPLIKTKWDEDVTTCEILAGGGYDKDGYAMCDTYMDSRIYVESQHI
ncbi:the ARF-like 2 binding protein BART-domain-containing protein [Pavlovales sp. CCMP2436]|nr:the ARF-like 2 binding protein BART-domain-containing protein [Pavlovales sp. CCMP2436]